MVRHQLEKILATGTVKHHHVLINLIASSWVKDEPHYSRRKGGWVQHTSSTVFGLHNGKPVYPTGHGKNKRIAFWTRCGLLIERYVMSLLGWELGNIDPNIDNLSSFTAEVCQI